MEEYTTIAYKGFDYNLSCRGFQYEVGKEYEIESGDIVLCANGFHACQNPIDVLRYYGNNMLNRFCIVELSGKIVQGRYQYAAQKIKILKEINAEYIYKAWMEQTVSKQSTADFPGGGNFNIGNLDKDYSLIGVKTSNEHIASKKDFISILSRGEYNHINLTGDHNRVVSSGRCAEIMATGNGCLIVSKGFSDNIVTLGIEAQICATTSFGQISANGPVSKIGALGENMSINANGEMTQIWSGGDFSQINTTGFNNVICSSGDFSQITTSGNYTYVESKGKNAVICCAGRNSVAKAKKGSYITLTEWNEDSTGYYTPGYYKPICTKTEIVDGERIKEDTWYYIKNGEFADIKNAASLWRFRSYSFRNYLWAKYYKK